MEVDLSRFTVQELDAMVAAEKLRRRDGAVAELEAVAARYGYSLAELARTRKPGNNATRGPKKHKRGEASEIIRHGIANGKSAKEIAAILGWKAVTGVYGTASKMGLKFPRAA